MNEKINASNECSYRYRSCIYRLDFSCISLFVTRYIQGMFSPFGPLWRNGKNQAESHHTSTWKSLSTIHHYLPGTVLIVYMNDGYWTRFLVNAFAVIAFIYGVLKNIRLKSITTICASGTLKLRKNGISEGGSGVPLRLEK